MGTFGSGAADGLGATGATFSLNPLKMIFFSFLLSLSFLCFLFKPSFYFTYLLYFLF